MAESKITSIHPSSEEETGPLVRILKNKKLLLNILYGVILVGLTIGLIGKKVNQARSKNMSVAYASLDDQFSLQSHADLKQVKRIASKHSFLQPHLDAPLAQEYLNQKDFKSSKKLHNRLQSRIKPNLAAVFKFNEITFLISQQKLQEALKLSKALKKEINQDKMPALYAYQLLRIAELEKRLNEKESYDESLKEFLSADAMHTENTLKLGDLTLKEYLTSSAYLR